MGGRRGGERGTADGREFGSMGEELLLAGAVMARANARAFIERG
jgi:hypothetical protein